MGSFLITILCIISGFYLFGLIARVLLRVWLAKKMKDIQSGKAQGAYWSWNSRQGFGRQSGQEQKKEGEVTITKLKDTDRNIDKTVGDYVDYDEVKEN